MFFLNYWTPCQCIQIRIGIEPSKPHIHIKKSQTSWHPHFSISHPPSLTHFNHAPKNQYPPNATFANTVGVRWKRRSPAGEMPSGVHQHGMAAKKKGGGYALTRVHLLHCLFFYFIGFGCWFEWLSSRLLISKGSIWAIQMGKLEAEVTWTWS